MKNKVAVITGSKGGIGRALVERLREEGVRVICIDLYTENTGNENKCDFTRPSIVSLVSNGIYFKEKKIDYLFNVAGIGIYKSISTLDWEEFENSYKINVLAPFILSKNLLPRIQKSDDPMIFNIGSKMGVIPTKNRTAYCMSKFALRGLSLSLSQELKGKVDVCLLTLGSVMDNFGTGGIELRKQLQANGKKYLKISDVVDKIIEVTKSQTREDEYILEP